MSLAKKETDLTNEQTSVNPAANTKRKSTQVQSPTTTHVSAHGNTTDGATAGNDPSKTAKIRSNPQGNRPASVASGKGPGKQGN